MSAGRRMVRPDVVLPDGALFTLAAQLAANRFMPVPPPELIFRGDGDYRAIGAEFLGHFVRLGGLAPHKRMLDLGRGVGRMAADMLGSMARTWRQALQGMLLAVGALLHGIDLHVAPGSLLLVSGAAGAGKSTLARVLVGVLPPTNGAVLLDGAPIAQANRAEKVGYLPGRVRLLDGSVFDNIARFQDAPPEAVVEAAKAAGMHGQIGRLAEGYATFIGPGTALLSGGRKQRLGLARALFGAPRLPVLDLVPLDDALLVAGAVRPGDIERVMLGQAVNVRLTAFSHRRVPPLPGRLVYVGADRQVSAQGEPFFPVRAVLDADAARHLPGITLTRGMPSEMLVPRGQRTALDHFRSPLLDGMRRAPREDQRSVLGEVAAVGGDLDEAAGFAGGDGEAELAGAAHQRVVQRQYARDLAARAAQLGEDHAHRLGRVEPGKRRALVVGGGLGFGGHGHGGAVEADPVVRAAHLRRARDEALGDGAVVAGLALGRGVDDEGQALGRHALGQPVLHQQEQVARRAGGHLAAVARLGRGLTRKRGLAGGLDLGDAGVQRGHLGAQAAHVAFQGVDFQPHQGGAALVGHEAQPHQRAQHQQCGRHARPPPPPFQPFSVPQSKRHAGCLADHARVFTRGAASATAGGAAWRGFARAGQSDRAGLLPCEGLGTPRASDMCEWIARQPSGVMMNTSVARPGRG
jgi:ABC-type iron transport system FetAB ATPase subunit